MPHQPRVLVVDDDDNIVSAFEDFLRKEHCTMVSASNAEDALSVISHQTVNLVITDIKMKWQSGVTLLMKIKQMHSRLPVIVITGYPNLIPEADIRHLGAEHLFVKPLELDQLRDAVRNCLNRAAVSTHRNL
jgi:DNA-binding NtrC family response regulator